MILGDQIAQAQAFNILDALGFRPEIEVAGHDEWGLGGGKKLCDALGLFFRVGIVGLRPVRPDAVDIDDRARNAVNRQTDVLELLSNAHERVFDNFLFFWMEDFGVAMIEHRDATPDEYRVAEGERKISLFFDIVVLQVGFIEFLKIWQNLRNFMQEICAVAVGPHDCRLGIKYFLETEQVRAVAFCAKKFHQLVKLPPAPRID